MVLLVARFNCETSPRDFIVLADSIPIPKKVFTLDKLSLVLFILKIKALLFGNNLGFEILKGSVAYQTSSPTIWLRGREVLKPKFSL